MPSSCRFRFQVFLSNALVDRLCGPCSFATCTVDWLKGGVVHRSLFMSCCMFANCSTRRFLSEAFKIRYKDLSSRFTSLRGVPLDGVG